MWCARFAALHIGTAAFAMDDGSSDDLTEELPVTSRTTANGRAALPVIRIQRWDSLRKELHQAAAEGDGPAVEALFRQGAHVNAQDALGRSALHWACAGGHLACAEVLLSNGSNVHDRDFMGTSAMSLACGSQNTDLCWLLLKWGADFSGLCSNGAKWLADQMERLGAEAHWLRAENARLARESERNAQEMESAAQELALLRHENTLLRMGRDL